MHTPRPTTAIIKGDGFNSAGGGFTRIHINGITYHPNDVALAVNAHPELVKALEAAKVVIGMMERPDGLGADISSALDQRVARIDAAISLTKGEGK